MFKHIRINNFRVLKDKDIDLGKYITVFAGWNAAGKSTLLALLANSTELKVNEGRTYSGKQFRAEFSEIIKGSMKYDQSEQDKLEIEVTIDGNDRKKTFRTAWQKDTKNNDRFRVIPKETDKNGKLLTEAKFPLPVLYLGLSRLYPIGECSDDILSSQEQSFSKEDKEWFTEKYNFVLSKHENIQSVTNIDVKTSQKEKMGINTDAYDWRTNSAGQDNVSQILKSILSFKKLKREQGTKFKGGLLIIDELEASLHPKAQEKMFDKILLKSAKEIGIQIIFTTHSLTLIKKACEKSNNDTIISHYFTFENHELQIKKNADYDFIEKDLLISPINTKCKKQKITVYSEDEEARWFIKKLLRGYNNKLDFRNIKISCSSLVDLMNCEPCFKNYIVIFDGDFDQDRRITMNKQNYLILPTTNDQKISPEKELHTFLFSEKSNEYFQNSIKKNPHLKREYFEEHDVDQDNDKKERDNYKEWFNMHKSVFDKTGLFFYWKKQNKEIAKKFTHQFLEKLERLSQNCY